ncbi:MAG TPA: IclR family transcriptional regulator [Bryobacteraceae bacterium]|nr:IclR family transcriptional regulator [Bryobacteraceae bacterium]
MKEATKGSKFKPARKPSKPQSHSSEAYQSKSIGRALDVLSAFSPQDSQLGLRELSRRLCLPETTVFRICATLQSRGYLTQNLNGTFELAPRVLYGTVREEADKLRQFALPSLQALALRFDETTSLAYMYENRIEVLHTLETLHQVRVANCPGRVLPPHCSSLGKSIAAFQDREKAERILQAYGLVRRTPNTITDRLTLFDEYRAIRERGYCFDREEAAEGQFCIGAPIVVPGRPVQAAISLSMPVARINSEREPAMVATVLQTAAAIAALLL